MLKTKNPSPWGENYFEKYFSGMWPGRFSIKFLDTGAQAYWDFIFRGGLAVLAHPNSVQQLIPWNPSGFYFWFGLGLSASPCDEPGFAPLHYSHDHHVLTQVLTFLHSPYGLDVGQVWCSGLLNDQPRVPEPLHNLHPASLGWCSQNPFRYILLEK